MTYTEKLKYMTLKALHRCISNVQMWNSHTPTKHKQRIYEIINVQVLPLLYYFGRVYLILYKRKGNNINYKWIKLLFKIGWIDIIITYNEKLKYMTLNALQRCISNIQIWNSHVPKKHKERIYEIINVQVLPSPYYNKNNNKCNFNF